MKRRLRAAPETSGNVNLAPPTRIPLDQVVVLADLDYCRMVAAEAIHSISAYGRDWPTTGEGLPRWNSLLNGLDTGATWCFDVRYRESDDLEDDIRFAWELNRLVWLVPPAAVWARDGDEASARFTVAMMDSFLETDRVGMGLRWNSMIELAMQLLAIVSLDSLMAGNESWEALRRRIGRAIRERYRWIEALPSLHSSANNHRLAELAALAVGASRIPELEDQIGVHLETLAGESRGQFGGDGFNSELSFDYHTYALDLIVSTIELVGERARSTLGQHASGIAHTTLLIEEFAGLWPSVGDSDEACLLSSLVPRSERAKWLSSLAANSTDHGGRVERGKRFLTLPDAGYTFLRDEFEAARAVLLADHGQLGFGAIAAHAHADSLAIWLWVNDHPWLVEAGTYSYHSNGAMRDLLRSSSMHSCITVNDISTSVPDGPFLWNPKRMVSGTNGEADEPAGEARVRMRATIPALRGVRPACRQTRTVEAGGGAIRVADEVTAPEGVTIAQHFIVAPGFRMDPSDSDDTVSLSKAGVGSIRFKLDPVTVSSTVENVPISPSYGVVESGFRVSLRLNQPSTACRIDTRIKLRPFELDSE